MGVGCCYYYGTVPELIAEVSWSTRSWGVHVTEGSKATRLIMGRYAHPPTHGTPVIVRVGTRCTTIYMQCCALNG